jgi:phage-related protein
VQYFRTIFLIDVEEFINGLDKKTARKVFYNIRLAEKTNDARLFKKLDDVIWEFRTRYMGLQIRLLAFWDKTGDQDCLVVATHGFLKKTDKIPTEEIKRAKERMRKYFNDKD